MKRKIIIALLIQTVVFLGAGLLLAQEVRTATVGVEQLVSQHQVEHLREQFLLQVHAVQSDLILEDTHRSRPVAVFKANTESISDAIDGCTSCHHTPASTAQLRELKVQTDRYRRAIDRWAATPHDTREKQAAADVAFQSGEQLIASAAHMIDRTTRRLETATLASMAELDRAKFLFYGLVVLGPIISVLLGLRAIASVTRPFDALLEATRRLRAGDLDHRVEGLHDEFQQLALSFNEMAGSLKEQMLLMQRTEQLVIAGEFAAGLVHEIKNPLAGIKAAVQVLAAEAALSDEDRALLRRVAHEVVELEVLLKGFLEFARPAKPRLDDVDVNGLVELVIGFYLRTHVSRPERPVKVVKELGDVPPARVDPQQLQQVLLNLLLNAVDAMPEGGTVRARTTWAPASSLVAIEIADQGKGISPEHVQQVFRPFFTTKSSGTGLGLAVSKRLVEQHGGTLTFSSPPGGGTTFRIALPAAEAAGLARSA